MAFRLTSPALEALISESLAVCPLFCQVFDFCQGLQEEVGWPTQIQAQVAVRGLVPTLSFAALRVCQTISESTLSG
jgi:hypothetical protein